MVIPALYPDGTARDQFVGELGLKIGEDNAQQFVNAATEVLGPQLAYWGTAEQTIEIDVTREPPRITQRFEKGNRILGSRDTEYRGGAGRFDHMFEIPEIDEQNKSKK